MGYSERELRYLYEAPGAGMGGCVCEAVPVYVKLCLWACQCQPFGLASPRVASKKCVAFGLRFKYIKVREFRV